MFDYKHNLSQRDARVTSDELEPLSKNENKES
jgi:hypothetical protein